MLISFKIRRRKKGWEGGVQGRTRKMRMKKKKREKESCQISKYVWGKIFNMFLY